MGSVAAERSLPLLEESELCVFNGIDGTTGQYMLPPLSPRQIADLARREPRYHLPGAARSRPGPSSPQDKGPGESVNPRDLSQTGWGVVFSNSTVPAVREALSPLLAHRQGQAERKRKDRYRELTYRRGETKTGFVARQRLSPGPANPSRLPYYLLLVGSPEEIPFEFQYQLDVQYAVGRIHFDTPEDYARYARSVVDAEAGKAGRKPVSAFFGPRNFHDPATARSAAHLAAPLAQRFGSRRGWSACTLLGEAATKSRLEALLEGDRDPALLFTAGHGLCFRLEDPRQPSAQGSIVCQDWPGPGCRVEEGHYFGAADVSDQARIAGMIAFLFSCYGAGTPRKDSFPEPVFGKREIAPRAFLSRLAQRFLAHPNGGALAVVGHVDRAWGWSFGGPENEEHTLRPVFENALQRLMSGFPIGHAMEYFNVCYAELASDLDEELRHRIRRDSRIAQLWTHRNDARSYAVLGDPAVRLAVARQEEAR